MRMVRSLVALGLLNVILPLTLQATDYNVGPGQTYTTIGAVPWYNLQPGDSVYIHYQPTPYYEKFLISTRSTAWPGLRVIGVVGPNGELPIIDGQNATTGNTMHWRTSWELNGAADIENEGVVSIVASAAGNSVNPAYVDIENLAIRNGRSGYAFTNELGATDTYDNFAAAIYAKNPQHLKIVNCELSNSQNGFFNATANVQGSPNWWDGLAEDIVISGCYFHGNGDPAGDVHEHSIYVQADRPVIEYCRFGPMIPGTGGNQIKSRSAGDIIRYNYMEGEMGARFLDLVEEQDSGGTLAAKSYYGHDFVYGNIFVRTLNDAYSGEGDIHWDGDHYTGGRAQVPGARLYFYDNTWVYNGTYNAYDYEPLFSIQDAGDDCYNATTALTSQIDARNNIFYSMGSTPKQLWWASCENTNVNLLNNWVTTPMAGDCSGNPGTGRTTGPCTVGTITGASTNITPGGTPGFVNIAANDVHLTAGSTALGQGAALAPEVTNNAFGLDLTPNLQYVYHLQTIARSDHGAGSDLGALSFGAALSTAPVITSVTSATGTVGTAFSYQITANQIVSSYTATGLPSGLTISTTTGLISGTPTTVGISSITLSATNAGGTGTVTLVLTISAAQAANCVNTGYPDGCPGSPPGTVQNPNLLDLQKVVMLNILGGSGYTNGTYTWTATGCNGSGATGTVTVSGGEVGGSYGGSYTISNEGSGYTCRPTIAIPTGAGSGSGALIVPSVYQAVPPWNAPGVNYYVGIPNTITLKDPTTPANLPSGAAYAFNRVTVTGCNVTLDGFDFDSHNTNVTINESGSSACTTTIQNSKFSANANGIENILISGSNLGSYVIQQNEFNGKAPPGSGGSGIPGFIGEIIDNGTHGNVTLLYNYCHDADSKCIQISGGSTTRIFTEKYNLFTNIGTCTSGCPHGEAEYTYGNVGASLAVSFSYNTYFNEFRTTGGDETAAQAVQADAVNITGTTDDHNVILSPGPEGTCNTNNQTAYTSAANVFNGQQEGGAESNVSFAYNYLDNSGTYFPWYPDNGTGDTFGNNVDAGTGGSCNPAGPGTLSGHYYIDYVNGNDSNNGTSKSTPWQHAPGMQTCTNLCNSTTIKPGDSIILKGGVTWPNSSFMWNLPGGATGNPVYVGVDKSWFTGSSWSRPILSPGGAVIPNNYDTMFSVPANVTIDNFEISGFYWTSAACSGAPYGDCGIFNAGQRNGQTWENLYIHGWTHAGTDGPTSNGVIDIIATGGGGNSVAHDNVIVGTDVPGDHSVNVFFNGPPIAYNNYIKQVSSAFIVSYATSIHDNHIEDIGPAYCNMPVAQYAGYCTHENGFEDNADNGLDFYNNVISNINYGLAIWIAPDPAYTASMWNNVIYAVHDNQILDFALPVYNNGSDCSTGKNSQGYCNNGGTFVFENNTVECGDDTKQYDFCGSNWGASPNAAAGLVFTNNHFIDATTASGCASGATNCTFTSNVVQTLAMANGQGYNSSQTYAFSPTAVGNSTLQAGTNLASSATGNLASLANDTSYGVTYDPTNHTVLVPARTTIPRFPSGSGAWDAGAYQFGNSTGTVNPPVITSPLSSSGTVGIALSYQITANQAISSFTATGLPVSLNLNNVTGLISGTPMGTDVGSYIVSLSATNSNGTGTATLSLLISSAIPPPPPPPPVLPSTPTLSLPAYLPLNAMISATYTGTDPASYYQWSFTPVSQIPSGSLAASKALAAGAPSASFTTSSPQANLGTVVLGLGPYLVAVNVYDSNNHVSAPAQAYVTMVPGDLSGVRVYPNPWRSDKHGGKLITFDNLAINSTIKIFTVSGHWVKTLPTSSTSVTWDLTNDSGDKVASGLYVYLIKTDNGQKKTGQVAIIK